MNETNETGLERIPEEALSTEVDWGSIEPAANRPAGLPAGREGIEDLTAADVKLPRLAIAQTTSKQAIPGAARIAGLELFSMFNDLTNEVYGPGPLRVVPVLRMVRWIEWDPEQRGVPRDLDVPVGDPRTKWRRDPSGDKSKDLPPLATEYVEFVCLLLRAGRAPEPIVVSIKTTNKHQRSAADKWTTYSAIRPTSLYTGMYDVSSHPETNDDGIFGVFTVENKGYVPSRTPAGAALLSLAKSFHDSLAGKTIVVNREGDVDDFREPGMEG